MKDEDALEQHDTQAAHQFAVPGSVSLDHPRPTGGSEVIMVVTSCTRVSSLDLVFTLWSSLSFALGAFLRTGHNEHSRLVAMVGGFLVMALLTIVDSSSTSSLAVSGGASVSEAYLASQSGSTLFSVYKNVHDHTREFATSVTFSSGQIHTKFIIRCWQGC